MKKAGKIIFYIFSTFILLVVILVLVAVLAKKKITEIAIEQVSQTINIPVQVEDIEFSLIQNFPFATIQCKNLWVSSPVMKTPGTKDTLVYIGQLFVSVETKPLLKSVFNIRKVEVEDAELFYQVDTAGVSNFDFLTDTMQQNVIDTSANSIFLDIKDMVFKNATCHYKNRQLNATAEIHIEELDLSGLMDNNQIKGEAECKISLSNCSLESTKLYLMKQTLLDFKLEYEDGLLTVKNAVIKVDEDAEISLNGSFTLGEHISTDVVLTGEKLDLGSLSKYVPDNLFQEYEIHEFKGLLKTEAKISGLISDSLMPAVKATFEFSEGKLRYQDYPALNNVLLRGEATNGEQKDLSTSNVSIELLSFQTERSKFKIDGKVTNLNKPEYKINTTLDLELGEFNAFVPDTLLQSLEGRMNAKISTKGVMPDSITDDFIQSVLANTKANLKLTNVNANIDTTLAIHQLNSNIDYKPNQIMINSFSARIPSYDLDVKNLNATIDGNFTKPESLQFKLNNINAIIPTYSFELKNLNAELSGDITNPESLDIKINNLLAELENNNIALEGTVSNPMAPDYSVNGKINLNLEEMMKFVPDSLVNTLTGNVMASFHSAAKINLDSIGAQIFDVIFANSSFNLNLDDVSVDAPDSMMCVNDLSVQLKYNSDTLKIEQFRAGYLGLELRMNSVTATNLYSAAILNQPKELRVQGIFSVDSLDYSLLGKFMDVDSTAIPEPEAEPMNFTYKINGKFKTNSIKYEDAVFSNVSSKFLVKNNFYVLDSLKMNAFNGKALSSVKIEMKANDAMDMYFKTDISKMDITTIMQGFGEYVEYEDIGAENVKGIISTKMDGKIVLQNFEPDYGSLLLNGDLTIENGALINVKSVMEVEKIKGIGLKNMDKLYFSKLNSSIFLFENELYIPRTEIKSTSFDAMFLGMYSFGEDYDYHIRMFLGEVLTSKSKANLKKQTLEGGFTDDDEKDITKGRTSIYLVSRSENGKEKAGFDKKRDRANMVAKVNLQKQMVDMRFHPTLVKYNTEEK